MADADLARAGLAHRNIDQLHYLGAAKLADLDGLGHLGSPQTAKGNRWQQALPTWGWLPGGHRRSAWRATIDDTMPIRCALRCS